MLKMNRKTSFGVINNRKTDVVGQQMKSGEIEKKHLKTAQNLN